MCMGKVVPPNNVLRLYVSGTRRTHDFIQGCVEKVARLVRAPAAKVLHGKRQLLSWCSLTLSYVKRILQVKRVLSDHQALLLFSCLPRPRILVYESSPLGLKTYTKISIESHSTNPYLEVAQLFRRQKN